MRRYVLYICVLTVAFANGIDAANVPTPLNFRIQSYQDTPHKIIYLYAHGLGATHKQGLNLYHRIKGYDGSGKHAYHTNWIIDGPVALFDFADAKNDDNEFHRKHVNLGQELDILRLDQAYQRTQEQMPADYMIVVIGLSRGATTILNWLSLRQPSKVAAVIIESAFDSLDNVVAHIIKKYKLSWIPLSGKMGSGIMSLYFPSIDLHGVVPSKTVAKINPEIPILIVHSKKDQVIPIKSSRNLYCQLVETGHHKVHFLELPSGRHGKLIKDEHGTVFQNVAHAFFAHYSLPHDADLALQGKPAFGGCQPPVHLVKQQIRTRSLSDDELDNDEI